MYVGRNLLVLFWSWMQVLRRYGILAVVAVFWEMVTISRFRAYTGRIRNIYCVFPYTIRLIIRLIATRGINAEQYWSMIEGEEIWGNLIT